MSSLFIANTSKQHHDFYFRRPEAKQNTLIPIKAGQQVQVLKEVTSDVVDFVIAQHRKYGLMSAEEAARKHKGFTGLVYSVDKPAPAKLLLGTFENNDRVLKEVAKENLANQAGATMAKIQDNLQEQGIDANLRHMEVEITEQVKPGEEAKMEDVKIEVAAKGNERRPGKRQR
jgi:hypothetical protein